jgi:hypothetical protein
LGGIGENFPNGPDKFGSDQAQTKIAVLPNGGSETRPKNAAVYWIIRFK